MYDYDPEEKSYKTTSVHTKYVEDNSHNGSRILGQKDFPDYEKNAEAFEILHEIAFDIMLSDNGYSDGVIPFLENGNDLHTFGPDMFYKKGKDGEEGHITISEYNVRIINSKRALGGAIKIDPDIPHRTPHSQLKHPRLTFNKDMVDAMMEAGPEKTAEVIQGLIQVELDRMPKAAVDTIRFSSHDDGSSDVQMAIFFPYASEDGKLEHDITRKIAKRLSKISPEMLKSDIQTPISAPQEGFMLHGVDAVAEYSAHLEKLYQMRTATQ